MFYRYRLGKGNVRELSVPGRRHTVDWTEVQCLLLPLRLAGEAKKP
jgi:hypothetical protein